MRAGLIKRYSAVGKTATDGSILFPVNNLAIAFAVAAAILYSSDATGGASTLQYTLDPMDNDWIQPVQTVSQATTVITVTDPLLPTKGGIAVGDIGKIAGTGIVGLDGEWVCASTPSATSYTLTSSVSQSAVGTNARAGIYRLFNSAIASAANARAAGCIFPGVTNPGATPTFSVAPISALVLNVTALTAGSTYLQLLQAMGR